MEGLIPMVFKAIKRNRVRREYRCLSSESAQNFNRDDFYINYQSHVQMMPSSTNNKVDGFYNSERNGHRRHKSVGDYGVGFSSTGRMEAAPPAHKKLVRFRSHRMFSCITGA